MNTDRPSNTNETNEVIPQGMLPFEGFIHLLKANGFVLGMDNYLQLQALLNQLEPNCTKQRLKLMMGPLFCSTPEQQVLFGRLFDDYFQANMPRLRAVRTSTSEQSTSQKLVKEEKPKSLWEKTPIYIKWGLLISLSVASIAFVLYLYSNLFDAPVKDFGNVQLDDGTSPFLPFEMSKNISYIILSLLVVFIGFLFYRSYRKNRKDKQLALDSQRLRKPMLHWRIEVPQTKLSLFSSQNFYKATRLLKSREQSESRYLNVPKTIRASLANMGFPKLQYDFRTKPPEYLVLIDKASYRDHQATYFDSLYKALEEQEIYAERYYYRKQPTTCWNGNDQGFDLETLLKKYHSHRLIIMGDVQHLFDPFTGMLMPELYPILLWKYKAVLSAQQASPAVVSALNTYSNFVVLTANMENLLSLQDALTMSEPYQASTNGMGTTYNSTLEHLSNKQIIKNLKKKLDAKTFEWLCVCAVYPELNWPFTLYLGKQVFGEELLTEARILKLVQLPWYRDGLIPDKLRTALINTLSEERLTQVRQVILDWLKDNPPQVDNVRDQSEYELYIAMEAAMLDPESDEKKRWLQTQVRKPETKGSRYKEIVLQYLEEEVDKDSVLALPAWVRGLFGVKKEEGEKEETDDHLRRYVYPKANVGKRIYAKLIDWPVILFIFWFINEKVLRTLVYQNISSITADTLEAFYWFMLFFLFATVEGIFGGMGKRVFGLMTITIKQNKQAVWLTIARRYLDVAIIAVLVVAKLFFIPIGPKSGDTFDNVLMLIIFLYTMLNLYFAATRNDGRIPIDFFAGTQVVNKKDFMAGNFIGSEQPVKPKDLQAKVEEQREKEKEESGINYIYPMPEFKIRIFAKLIDWALVSAINVLLFLGLMSLPSELGIIDLGGDGSFELFFSVFLLLFYVLIINIDGLFKGIGKRLFGLICIEVNTNKPVTFRRNAVRYLDVFLLMCGYAGLGFMIANKSEMAQYIYALIYSIFFIGNAVINIIYAKQNNGRLPIDFLFHTQTVSKKDYVAGNYIGNEESLKPTDLQTQVEEQKTVVTPDPLTVPEQEQVKEPGLEKVPVFRFYSEDEIKEQVAQVSRNAPRKTLLLFKTSKQQTWLVSAGRNLFCLLDSAKTRAGERKLIQWKYRHARSVNDLYIRTKPNPRSKRTGFIDIGNHRNWYYTLRLHPDPENLADKIRNLLLGSSEPKGKTATAKKVYISYSSKDLESFDELYAALSPLQESGEFSIWGKRNVRDDEKVGAEVTVNELNQSDIILMLVSPQFLASVYIYDVEMRLAMERVNDPNDDVVVIPVILKPCAWQELPIGGLSPLPVNGRPITNFLNRDEAYYEIIQGLKSTISLGEQIKTTDQDSFDQIKEAVKSSSESVETAEQKVVEPNLDNISEIPDPPSESSEQIQQQTSEPIENISNDITPPKRVFISDTGRDSSIRDSLLRWLKPLENEGLITILESSYKSIQFEVDEERTNDLETADIFLMLFSEVYATSSWARREILMIRNRIEDNPQTVIGIPLILNQCDWERHLRGVEIQAIGADNPILERVNINMAWTEVTNFVRALAEGYVLPKTRPFTNIPDDGLKISSLINEARTMLKEERIIDTINFIRSNFEGAFTKADLELLATLYHNWENLITQSVYSEEEVAANMQRIIADLHAIIDGLDSAL